MLKLLIRGFEPPHPQGSSQKL